jgi:hypothetical protein
MKTTGIRGFGRRTTTAALGTLGFTAAALFSPAASRAAQTTDVYGGAYFPSSTSASVGLGITHTLPIALGPAEPQASLFVPLGGVGRYALTGEVRTSGRTYFGVGGGLGKLNNDTGFIVDALAGIATPIPNTSIAVKFWSGVSSGRVGSGGFAGLSFRL